MFVFICIRRNFCRMASVLSSCISILVIFRLRQSVEVKDASIDDIQSKLSTAERERARLLK